MREFSVAVAVYAFTGLAESQTVPAQPVKPEPPAITLKAGDQAPSLKIDEWIKGESFTGFEKGTVYVVEFWATWCGPCIKSMPHLSDLQRKHKDVVVLGVAASEKVAPNSKDERLKKLKDFVTKKGDGMAYRVAYDGDGDMKADWMRAAGQNGIPCSFIVGRDGKITWIGHPEDLDQPLAKAIAAK